MMNFVYFFTILLIIGTVYLITHGKIFFKDYYFYDTSSLIVLASFAKKLLKYNRIDNVIDVRTPQEFAAGHYKDATNIPLDNINLVTKYIPNRKNSILIYSTPDDRALRAVEQLVILDYLNVRYINEPYRNLL